MSQFKILKEGVALISLNRPPVNGLSVDLRRAVLNNVDRAMKENMKAIVLAGEGSMFSGGADIKEIARGAYFKSPTLTELTNVLDSCNIPVISGIHGYALGGAMEIGLASHYRVATKTAKIGFPEVNLGLLSGSGGTQRLTRLLGAKHALDLLTTGKLIGAMEAAKLGIVDNVLSHGASFHDELADFALSDRVQNTPLSERRLSMRMVPGTTTDEGGVLVVDKEHWANILEVTTANARGQIAPLAILKCVQAAMATQTQGFEVGQSVEEQLLQVLMKGPQATALQYLFLSEKKCSTVPKDSDLRTQHVPLPDGKDKKTVAITEVKSVGVVGGGTMGAGIVMSCIGAGIPVVLVETSTELAAAALLRIERIYQSSSAYRTGRMSKADLKERLNLITVTRFFERLADVDLVIEAVPESLKLKQEVFAQLDKMCKSSAILATNTSYLDIDQIGSVTSRPHNVVGTHFFSPANVQRLVEVVKGKHTEMEVVDTCLRLSHRLAKVGVVSGNCPGFIGNRMLTPYKDEAVFLLEEGATPQQVDRVLKEKVGFAMGLFEVMDLAGNDIGYQMRKEFGLIPGTDSTETDTDRSVVGFRYSKLPDKLCEAGHFGQKSGQGWYEYDPSSPRKPVENPKTIAFFEQHRAELFENGMGVQRKTPITDQEIIERCLYPLVNEGFKLLEEGIALRPEDIDVIYTYGYGFPKYRGGPMMWAEKEVTLVEVLSRLIYYHELYPSHKHFKPSRLLESIVQSGASVREEMYYRKQKYAAK